MCWSSTRRRRCRTPFVFAALLCVLIHMLSYPAAGPGLESPSVKSHERGITSPERPRFITGRSASLRLYSPEGQQWSSVFALDPTRLAALTHETQQWIHETQNPPNCSAASYVIYQTHSSGIGSNIHVAGFHAGLAWRVGRVLLWGETLGHEYTSPDVCGNLHRYLRV